jgi:hypothetical protein
MPHVTVWATSSLTHHSSKNTPTYFLHHGLLKRLLGVKKDTDTHYVLRETGQILVFSYWFRCILRFWNNLLSKQPLLEKFVLNDLLLANINYTWTYQILHALQDFPACQQFLDAIRSRESIDLNQIELTLRKHIIKGWREHDNLAHHMRLTIPAEL